MAVPKVKLRERKDTKGVSYFIDYTVNGKRHRQNVGTNRKTALEICQNVQAKLSLGQFDIYTQAENIISLKDLIKNFLTSKRNHIRASSLKRYQNYLEKFLEYMNTYFPAPSLNVKEIKTTYIDECFNYFLENEITNKKRWEPKTVNGLRAILIQLFSYGIKQEYLSSNPAKDTKTFRENGKNTVEYFTDEELEKIWNELDDYWVEPLKFILHTGLRKGEWINLIWKNVKLSGENPSITIVSSGFWQTKTGESRVIYLNQTALEIIKKQKGRNSEYVFTQNNGSKIHPDRPYHALKKALKNLGLEGDIHKLRHTFASKLVMKGESLYTVSKLLGHSDIQTTQIYAHLAPDYLKSAVDKLDEEGE
jgi:integrase